MAIVLIATLLVLIATHGAPALAQYREFGWLRGWQQQVGAQGGEAFGLFLCLAVPVLACGLVQVALRSSLLGLASLIFAIVILFYSWGPRDLERDVEAIDKAPDSDRRLAAAQALADARPAPLEFTAPALVEATFLAALRRWFGVLLWFCLLGPAGALLYRLAQQLAFNPALSEGLTPRQREWAGRIAHGLDWPAAHLMVLALALASNFDTVFKTWRDYHAAHGRGYFYLDLGFLDAIARASVDADVAAEDEHGQPAQTPLVALDDAMVLVRRVLVVWLTVIALIVLGGWFA